MQKGQSLIEILIVMALMAMLLPVLIGSLITSREGRPQQQKRAIAAQKLQETKEALRSIRESGWSNIQDNGTYHTVSDGTGWSLAPDPITENGITTQVEITSVLRDSSSTIVSSGGTVDPSTKRVAISISWNEPIPTSFDTTMYMTRYLDNATYIQTTEADFNTGEHNGTVVTNTSGGEVILGLGGRGDWCQPGTSIVNELDLPGSGNAKDVKAYEGKAFTGTHQGSGGSFVEVAIDNNYPPNASIESILTGYETNDVFIDGNYAYAATGDVSRDVIIIDLTTMQEVGYFNDTAWFGTAQGVYVKDNVGYVTIGFNLHTFDLSSKTGVRPELDRVMLAFFATGYRLAVVNGYAYVALDYGSSELRVVDVRNPSNIRNVAYANVNGQRGQEVWVNETGTRAYLATNSSSSQDELFIINTSNKSGSMPVISSYNASGMSPTGVAMGTGNKIILVGTGGEEYQVIDVTNENSPTKCGSAQVDSGIYGVSTVLESDGDAYSYIVTRDPAAEFKTIVGGPGFSYASSGIYESATFDVGYSTAFNRFIPQNALPPNTNIQYQVAITDGVSGSCGGAVFDFVGPDGTPSTFYTSDDLIPFDDDGAGFENPGRCFRYRSYLETSDSSSTPVFEEAVVNYSP